MSECLYFLAIIPPENVCESITSLKNEVYERFESKHAFNAPPHITLHMPFKWKDKKIDALKDCIAEINASVKAFPVELKGFDFFEPRVVFVNVIKNQQLESLQRRVAEFCRLHLKLNNADYKGRGFHPHITIGFRDLKKPMFYKAKEYYSQQTFDGKFVAEEVVLLKHDGKKWNPVVI